MTNKELVLDVMRQSGKEKAVDLRTKATAGELTDTEIIDAESYAPDFDPKKDYSNAPVGSPVKDAGQVYGLLQPYNAAHFDGRPATLRALWALKHTTNPAKAKPWVASEGTSGIYLKGECCTDGEAENPTAVYLSLVDNNEFAPHAYPQNWEEI